MSRHPSGSQPGSAPDPYRGVVLVLLALALLGALAALAFGLALPSAALFDAALSLGLAAGLLLGVALAQAARARPPREEAGIASSVPATAQSEPDALPHAAALGEVETPAPTRAATEAARPAPPGTSPTAEASGAGATDWVSRRFENLGTLGRVRLGTSAAGMLAVALLLLALDLPAIPQKPWLAGGAAAFLLLAAGLAALAARYLTTLDPARLPEASGLCRGARVVAWLLVSCALSSTLAGLGMQAPPRVLHLLLLAVAAALCFGLSRRTPSAARTASVFPLDLALLSLLGSRPNLLASALDQAEVQLGIDLRSTWALRVVRRGVEPLAIALALVGWVSTCLTIVGVEEQGLVERLGVPLRGEPLQPGLHLHGPWPFDRVFRVPVRRVQTLTVGHEGEEEPGPEDVLWARQHVENEYTLLLGDGRDLITVDAAVQFRIRDARAWRYRCQNPADALRAIAYRAVMRATVNRTLSEALSENVVRLTERMRDAVQRDADALGLGVEVTAFTVGGMHPPVGVAADYQAVVSAELRKVTATVDARAFRNQILPAAEAEAWRGASAARAEGAAAAALAAGKAWSFHTLEAQVGAAPSDFFFRRRLETLEGGLAGRPFTVVDARIQRDGGELWLMP